MSSHRGTARIAGLCYLLTFVSIPTLNLYEPLRRSDAALDLAQTGSIRLGMLLEIVVALACVGTAVALYPIVRRVQESLALGFVATRTIEAALILAGVATLHALLTTPAATLQPGPALTAHYDAVFLVSQSLMPGLNAILLGTLLYRARLVPRAIPLLGLLGAPLHLGAVALTVTGVLDRLSPLTLLAAVPIAAWEFALGVRLLGWGCSSAALVATDQDAIGQSSVPVRTPLPAQPGRA